jgi:hypothetical protein
MGKGANLLRGCEPFHLHDISRHAGIRPRGSADHLGGLEEEGWGNGQPERLGGLEVDDQLKGREFLDREIGRLGPPQDQIRKVGGTPAILGIAGGIGHEPPTSTYRRSSYIDASRC